MKNYEIKMKKIDKTIRKLNIKLIKNEFLLKKVPSEEELKRKNNVIFFLKMIGIFSLPILVIAFGLELGKPPIAFFVGFPIYVIDMISIPLFFNFSTRKDIQDKIIMKREKLLLELEKYKQIKKTYDCSEVKTLQQENLEKNDKKRSMYNYTSLSSVEYKGWNINVSVVNDEDDKIISNDVKVRKKHK